MRLKMKSKIKINNLGLIALLLVAVFAGAVTTASAATIPTNAKAATPDISLGDITTWSSGWSTNFMLSPNYVKTINFSPKRAGTWNTEAKVYGTNIAANKGVVEYAWRSGSGSWIVWRTAEYGRLDKGAFQTIVSNDAITKFRIRMYNPNIGKLVWKAQNLQSYFYIKKVK
jgi:hypothetical protein